MKKFFLLALFSIYLAGSVQAQSDKIDPSALALANPSSLNSLGMRYLTGRDVKKDYAQALVYFRAAAEKEDPDAQSNMGYCYENGLGVTKDYAEAAKWLKKAADQEEVNGIIMLGMCYYYGHGVPKNTEEGIRLTRIAAKKGSELAKQQLKTYNVSE